MLGAKWALMVFGTTIIVGALLVAACGDDDDEAKHPPGADAWGGAKLEVKAVDLAFEPKELRVKAQQRYLLHFVNKGDSLHDWTIDAIPASEVRVRETAEHGEKEQSLGSGDAVRMHVAAKKGGEAELSFIPMRRGEYTYYCTVPGHRSAGMEGKLVVE